MKLTRLIQSLVLGLAVLFCVTVPVPHAAAADRITLKGGQVIEGKIIREIDGYIWIEETIGGIAQPAKMLKQEDVEKVERDAANTPAKTDDLFAPKKDAKKDAPATVTGKAPKGVVLTLGDEPNGHMVGTFMTATPLRQAIPMLEQELGTDRTGIVVLRIHSGGGLGREVQLISDVIEQEYKKRFRTVGWIETAISAAAMAAHGLDELYFTRQGNYGACTGFYGTLDKPVEGFELEQALFQMEKISARGGWDPLIMRAMQVQQPLSARFDEDGKIYFFRDLTSGDIIVNREKEILTLTADSAKKINFSRGTADTLDELTKAMGYQEIDWVGEKVQGVLWPISRAERIQMEYRKKVKEDEANLNRYYREYQSNVETAGGMPRDRRAPFVGKARIAMEKLIGIVRTNPNNKFLVFNVATDEEWRELVESWDKTLRDLMR